MLRLEIKTCSPLMLGSGSGRGSLIDSDIVFDDNGLPFFPARRLKGLLRESAAEVLEMLEQAGLKGFVAITIEELFGSPTCPSAIRIHNLYPQDYTNTVKYLKYIGQEFPHLINKAAVMNALTDIRQKTAIDDKKGCAKENSLRTIRVLKNTTELYFQGEFEVLRLERREEIETLLALACQNLKRAGSGRNRGWGNISCRILSDDGIDLGQKVIQELAQWDKNDKRPEQPEKIEEVKPDSSKQQLVITNPSYTHKLEYRITNTSPLLFAAPDGDENMVTSMDYIPGTALHGFFANQLIRKNIYATDYAHKDAKFKSWFLDGTLCFSNAYLVYKESDYSEFPLQPTPLFLHTDKQKEKVKNLIATYEKDTKAIGGYCNIIGNDLITKNPDKAVNFHLVRNSSSNKARERLEGHGDDGGIFHYQAIKENQDFHGYILGTEESLQAFLDNFCQDSTAEIHIGRSISTQYGKAEITFDKVTVYEPSIDYCLFPNEDQEDDKYYLDYNQVVLYLISPLVLYNSRGYPELSLQELIAYLKTRLGVTGINIIKSFCKVETRDAFISHWKIHESIFRYFAAGSSFLLAFDQDIDKNLESKLNLIMREGLGEKRNQGYGQVRFVRQLPCPNQFYHQDNIPTSYEKPDELSSLAQKILDRVKKDYIERMVIAAAAEKARKYYFENIPFPLSSNLLGRLEAMVKESENPSDLAGKIDELRKKAKEPLQNIRLGGKSLYTDLTDVQLELWCEKETREQWNIIVKVSREMDNKLNISDKYQLYWRVFLRTLRKLDKKAADKKEGGQVNAMS